MDGNEEVSEEVIESHLSCFDDSGSDAGCDGDFSCEGGVDVDVDAPGRTVCARAKAHRSTMSRALYAQAMHIGRTRTSRKSFQCPPCPSPLTKSRASTGLGEAALAEAATLPLRFSHPLVDSLSTL